MIRKGDEFAATGDGYHGISGSQGNRSHAAVLEGRVNAIILTGGLAYSMRFTGAIRQRVDQIAPVPPGRVKMKCWRWPRVLCAC
jgi:butyrate kinase